MLDFYLDTAFRGIVMLTAVLNFLLLVFFYQRDVTSKREIAYAAAALCVAVGQLYVCVSVLRGRHVEWPEALMQVGLSVALYHAAGSIKKLMNLLAFHQIDGPYAYRRRKTD